VDEQTLVDTWLGRVPIGEANARAISGNDMHAVEVCMLLPHTAALKTQPEP
jgi:hypothetical protein